MQTTQESHSCTLKLAIISSEVIMNVIMGVIVIQWHEENSSKNTIWLAALSYYNQRLQKQLKKYFLR